ncbi:MAG: serine/threonine-protein phosphatase [Cyanobacteria bacterium J055]|nr:MAG: serine/threonine-protein phosphatase [Cyanobacteria bacterium J055]
MKADFVGLSDTGRVRPINQDSFYVDPHGRFFVVADGMGGHAAGQEASRIAKEAIQAYLEQYWDSPEPSSSLLENAFLAANQAILDDQVVHPENADMGTTAVALLFRPAAKTTDADDTSPLTTWYANLGDSRLYRLRGEELQQISEDDTWVAQAVQAGVLSPEEVRTHPWRHVLSQCLGREDMGEVEVASVDAQAGDRFLLCSAGLTEELTDATIMEYLASPADLKSIAQTLIDAAKEQGGHDNITVAIVRVEELGNGEP